MSVKIGFLINPIAGMGGRVGLKGTDDVYDKAVKLGAHPVARLKAEEMLHEFFAHPENHQEVVWFTCDGDMGNNELEDAGIKNKQIVYTAKGNTTSANDTRNACKKFLESRPDLLVFCGGDGTARDIFTIIDKKIPLLGIPSGVKMHSGVFGITTTATAKMLLEFINKRLTVGDVEIMDLDEELYRKGEWKVRLYGIAKGIVEPTYIQVGKSCFESVSDDEVKDELADHVNDELEKQKDWLFLFGPGGTIDHIAKKLHIEHTLLGIDAVYQKKLLAKDVNEEQILQLLNKYPKAKILLSPIGAQGFILGRGNLQLSPAVINKIGIENIIVVSTPSKLIHTPLLRVDTGDKRLDHRFINQGYLMVVIGYRLSRVVKLQTNSF
ncbi:MAG TPA: ATP-NAD kinase family protein [Candidatus Thermoplasmatota archaeon]|nr:ATP-NAD kinase family protein [Candidatus Thermoplasmatota archaeon]